MTSFRNVLKQCLQQSTTIILCPVQYLNLAPPDEALQVTRFRPETAM